MARKKNEDKELLEKEKVIIENPDTEVLKEEEKVIIVRAKKEVTFEQFDLLSKMLKKQEEPTGIKIVLLPFSVELEN